MDEIAWGAHLKAEKEAKEIHNTLLELYGADMSKETRRIRALKDHVIDDRENRLLREFCLG